MPQGGSKMYKHAFLSVQTRETDFSDRDRLSADEETELSKQILAGEAANQALSDNGRLSEEEKAALETLRDAGEQAYQRLVLANLPRAAKIAADTYRKNPLGLNTFDDYQQTALKVICKCARTYDWKLGCRFGTYVHRCLQHEMMRENAGTGYALRIPEETLPQLSALKRLSEIKGLDEAARELSMNTEDAGKLLLAGRPGKSLQDPVNADDSETELGETIADASAMTADEIESRIDHQKQLEMLNTALSQLPAAERDLLKKRMGFGGDPLPMRAFVGTVAKSISGVQKKQIAAEKHLREIYFSLPMAD